MPKADFARREVVVVFVHGINVTSQAYYIPMRDALWAKLAPEDREYVVFRPTFWADLLRGRQQEYLLYASTRPGFNPTRVHRMVIEGLGDATAYQKAADLKNSAYFEIQQRFKNAIADATTGESDSRPLIVIAHSLGCHIVSSYAWDIHKLRHKARNGGLNESAKASKLWGSHPWKSPFQCLETLAGLVSMGSNQPLFTFNIGPQFVHPLTKTDEPGTCEPAFPGPALDQAVRAQARHLNFYSGNDPLGYPLKPLNDAYDSENLLEDIHIRSEGFFRSMIYRGWFRPLVGMRAHSGYWTNRTVVSRTAQLISNIINADRLAPSEEAARPPAQPSAVPEAIPLSS